MPFLTKQHATDIAKTFTKYNLWQGGGGGSGEIVYTIFYEYDTNTQDDLYYQNLFKDCDVGDKQLSHIEFIFATRSNSDANLYRTLPSHLVKTPHTSQGTISNYAYSARGIYCTYQYLYARTAIITDLQATKLSNGLTRVRITELHTGNCSRYTWGNSTATNANSYVKLVEVRLHFN